MSQHIQGASGWSVPPPVFPETCWPLAELSPHPMVAVEGASRLVRYANRAFCLLLGQEERDLLGKSFDGVVPGGRAQRFSEAIDRVLARRAPEVVVEDERSLGAGSVPYTHWSLTIWAILRPGDEPPAAMIQVTDLTEIATFRTDATAIAEALLLSALREHESKADARNRNARLSGEIAQCTEEQAALRRITAMLERQIQTGLSELERANEALQGLMYAIAHNLRAPLRAITSTSRILTEEGGDLLSPLHQRLLERQTHNALLVSSLIDDMLDYGRLVNRPLVRRPVDLAEIVTDLSQRLAMAFPDRLLNVVVQESLLATADREYVTLVLYLLIDNAAKFSPRGGKISVGREEGDGGALYVRDEGIGFDMAHRGKLFEPFERLVGEGGFPGNGIGLAKVRRLVEMHGGAVWAESDSGKGSTFFFTIS